MSKKRRRSNLDTAVEKLQEAEKRIRWLLAGEKIVGILHVPYSVLYEIEKLTIYARDCIELYQERIR